MDPETNQVGIYIDDIYAKTKDNRLLEAKSKIHGLINKAVEITGLDLVALLPRLDFKPSDLTIEALEAFLAELRAIFWLKDFGFTEISPIQASTKQQPDFSAKYK